MLCRQAAEHLSGHLHHRHTQLEVKAQLSVRGGGQKGVSAAVSSSVGRRGLPARCMLLAAWTNEHLSSFQFQRPQCFWNRRPVKAWLGQGIPEYSGGARSVSMAVSAGGACRCLSQSTLRLHELCSAICDACKRTLAPAKGKLREGLGEIYSVEAPDAVTT